MWDKIFPKVGSNWIDSRDEHIKFCNARVKSTQGMPAVGNGDCVIPFIGLKVSNLQNTQVIFTAQVMSAERSVNLKFSCSLRC